MEKTTTWELGGRKSCPKLLGKIEAEVVVIGGGLTGLLSAYELSRQGKNVVLVEKDEIGSGATKFTTAFLTGIIDTDYSAVIKTLGLEKSKLIAQSHREAIDYIESIIEREKIEYEFKRCSNYIFSREAKEIEHLKSEAEILRSVGFDAILNTKNDLGFDSLAYIEVKNEARFHPMKILRELGEIITKNGGKIFEHTEALKVEKGKVVTTGGEISAPWIISATYGPFMKPLGLHIKKAYYTSYVLELKMPKLGLKEGIYQDTENPYHYFRVEKSDKVSVILGGGDHRSDIHMDESKKYHGLETYARELFKGMDFEIVRKWKGPIIESIDGLPYIGRYKDMLYATAFSGNGMTYAAISGMIFSDIIAGQKNEWQHIYNPGRLPHIRLLMIKGRDYIEELWNGVVKRNK